MSLSILIPHIIILSHFFIFQVKDISLNKLFRRRRYILLSYFFFIYPVPWTFTFTHLCYVHHHINNTQSDAIPLIPPSHNFLQLQEILDDGDRITIDKYERNTVLTVRKTTRIDSGKYKLVLTNSSGTCESIGDVVVLGKQEYLYCILIPYTSKVQ